MEPVATSDELHDLLRQAGWTVKKIDFKNGQYIAHGIGPGKQDVKRSGKSTAMALAALYQSAIRSNDVRRIATYSGDHVSDFVEIAEAYEKLPILDEKAIPAWKALAHECERLSKEIEKQVRVEVTDDPEPYETATELCEDIRQNRRAKVSSANIDHPVWSKDEQIAFRTVFEILGRCAADAQYSWVGVNRAYNELSSIISERARHALFVESIGQAAHIRAYGDVESKVGLIEEKSGIRTGAIGQEPQTMCANCNKKPANVVYRWADGRDIPVCPQCDIQMDRFLKAGDELRPDGRVSISEWKQKRVASDWKESDHPRDGDGKFVAKDDVHEVRHKDKGYSIKRCLHCGVLHKHKNGQKKIECPTCGATSIEKSKESASRAVPKDDFEVAKELGWTSRGRTSKGHNMFQFTSDNGAEHLVLAGSGGHSKRERERSALQTRKRMERCMQGLCNHFNPYEMGMDLQVEDEPGAPVVRGGQTVTYHGGQWTVTDIGGGLVEIVNQVTGDTEVVPTNEVAARTITSDSHWWDIGAQRIKPGQVWIAENRHGEDMYKLFIEDIDIDQGNAIVITYYPGKDEVRGHMRLDDLAYLTEKDGYGRLTLDTKSTPEQMPFNSRDWTRVQPGEHEDMVRHAWNTLNESDQ